MVAFAAYQYGVFAKPAWSALQITCIDGIYLLKLWSSLTHGNLPFYLPLVLGRVSRLKM